LIISSEDAVADPVMPGRYFHRDDGAGARTAAAIIIITASKQKFRYSAWPATTNPSGAVHPQQTGAELTLERVLD